MEGILRGFTDAEWEEIDARIICGESIDSAIQSVLGKGVKHETFR